MKQNHKTGCFQYRGWPLMILLLLGIVGFPPQPSQAKRNTGSVNALQGKAAGLRDPFWPVGYKPKPVVGSTTGMIQQMMSGDIDWNEAMKQVVINGVSSRAGGEYIAIINNEVKSVGESVSIWYGGSRYTWKVDGIAPPGSVKLRRVSTDK